jgi:hypothetical protein
VSCCSNDGLSRACSCMCRARTGGELGSPEGSELGRESSTHPRQNGGTARVGPSLRALCWQTRHLRQKYNDSPCSFVAKKDAPKKIEQPPAPANADVKRDVSGVGCIPGCDWG